MANNTLLMSLSARLSVAAISAILLTACQTDWQDPAEGAAVKGAIRAQSVYPDGRPDVPTYGGGRDGVTARSSIEAYQRSFLLPTGGVGGAAAPSTPSPAPTPTQ
ncbi:hypothetical protein [Polynucleobacter sp. MWH-Braz-FAM2G]|uniref:hypothetical protein n=1 Tax=Polynucleobacter sp. MWH-Braz-FAM2G TaxID=1855883 RepID=UPI001BFE059B|nr:hypothetical protein [Polynucleobacter sp. MWH-Braz-FAM2G]QWD89947.1 hypothetical protein FD973_06460 [Polynucleobacter sp. MWH-Braz-FAM2G]